MVRSAAVTRTDSRTLSEQSPTDLWLYEANAKYDMNVERAFMCAECRVFRFHSNFSIIRIQILFYAIPTFCTRSFVTEYPTTVEHFS